MTPKKGWEVKFQNVGFESRFNQITLFSTTKFRC